MLLGGNVILCVMSNNHRNKKSFDQSTIALRNIPALFVPLWLSGIYDAFMRLMFNAR